MMRNLLKLEAFDMVTEIDAGPSADYQTGFANGFAAGQQDAAATADRVREELVQTLTDVSFTYREARQDIVTSLGMLVAALIDSVLPHCVANGFARQVADLVMARCTANLAEAVTIHVHPDQVAAVQAAVEAIAGQIYVAADPALAPCAAWIGQGHAETYLDMDQHLTEISDLLSNLSPQHQRITNHG